MALQINTPQFPLIDAATLDLWRRVPAAVASDCMNRTQVMHSSVKPVAPDMRLAGQARTVVTMVGDSGPICELTASARPGEIIVVDAGGVEDIAVWGGMMTEEAHARKIGGAVVWGAIRDVRDIRDIGFNMFTRAVIPRGPHHGFGGIVDGPISAGGVPVRPGDVVLGDEDGVTVVPLEIADMVLERALAHLQKEHDWIAQIRAGAPIRDIFSF